MAKRGAKLKLTPELQNELCKWKRVGFSNKAVCDAAGIVENTLYDYIKRGEADIQAGKTTIFSEFLRAYKKAEAVHKTLRLQQIQKAADEGEWQAAAWELERCYPNEYGKRIAAEVTGKDGGAIKSKTEIKGKIKATVDLSALTDEELELFEELADKIIKK